MRLRSARTRQIHPLRLRDRALSSWGQPERHGQSSSSVTSMNGELERGAEGKKDGKISGDKEIRDQHPFSNATELEQDGEEGDVRRQSTEVKIR